MALGWSSTTSHDVTISDAGGDPNVKAVSTASTGLAVGEDVHNTGKYYFEVKVIKDVDANVGIVTTGGSTLVLWGDTGLVFFFAGPQLGPSFTDGDTCCLAIDAAAGRAWLRVNNDDWWGPSGAGADPATGTDGYDYTLAGSNVVTYAGGDVDSAFILQAAGQSFSYAPPSGFSEWSPSTRWTPANLATAPKDWFKSDAGVTGSPVSALANYGTNFGLAQATSGNRPTITGALNNLPVLGFDGADDVLQSTGNNSYAAGPYHVYIVQRRITINQYDNHFLVGTTWSDETGMSTQWRDNNDFEFFGNGYGPVYFGSSTGPAGSEYAPSQATDGFWHTLEVRLTTSPAAWFDANAQTLDETYTGFNVQAMNSRLLLGSNGNVDEGIQGSIAEFILLDYTPTADEQAQIQGYLAWKWGDSSTTTTDLVGKLPSGHTYKSAAPAPASDSPDATVEVTGSSATTSVGAVTVRGKARVTATGNALTSGLGNETVTLPMRVTATGNALTGSTGSVTVRGKARVTATGAALASALGNETVYLRMPVTVTGNALTGSTGSVAAQGMALVNLSGAALSGSLGNEIITAGSSTTVSGNLLATAVSDVAFTSALQIDVAGLTLTSGFGPVTIDIVAAPPRYVFVTGEFLSASYGDASVEANCIFSVTGEALTGEFNSIRYGGWDAIPDPSGNWTPVPTGSNSWTPVAKVSNDWTPIDA